ncbi:MAG: AhpC/TSA family protein [Gemmatimonadetes bacterium]|nr:AhpC/TSA family protein [Gemmatimonadota bacterium]
MKPQNVLRPRQTVPNLNVRVAGGDDWTLGEEPPENFTMIVFYRGFHCPICSRHLADLASKVDDFAERGVDVIAVSTDTRARAEQTLEEWQVDGLRIGYGLSLDEARDWGLFLSTSRGATSTGIVEPELFAEPATYLVRPDGTLYFGSVQTMPFARPSFREILGAIDFVLANDYPARGEVVEDNVAHADEAAD